MTNRGRSSGRGWGFKIDYDLAIAQDEAWIAWALRSIERGLYRRSVSSLDGRWKTEIIELHLLVLYFRDASTALGYSAQDVADLAAYVDFDVWKLFPELPSEQPGRAGHDRGKALLAELSGSFLYPDEETARGDLRRARASLARHRRNRDKYGRPAAKAAK